LLRFTLKILNSITIIIVWVVTLLSKRPDIVHVHTNSYTGFYVKSLLTLLARITGAKTVLHVHGGKFREFYENSCWFLRWIIRRLLSTNSCVIVLSRQWRNVFEAVGLGKTNMAVMPNSVFVPELPESKERPQQPTVLFMSYFVRGKGIYDLIEVIEQRRDLLTKCRFVLAGPTTYEWNEIAERIASLNLSESVEMPGSVVGDSKERAYKQADIYVLPSYAEGMPIGLLEAMSYGLVCITTPVGGIPEVIQDGQNGVLVPPGDTKALTEAIEMLICEPDVRSCLGREARATIEREYNWVDRASQIKELYLDLLGVQQGKTPTSEKDT